MRPLIMQACIYTDEPTGLIAAVVNRTNKLVAKLRLVMYGLCNYYMCTCRAHAALPMLLQMQLYSGSIIM